jgi:hypothetical protein
MLEIVRITLHRVTPENKENALEPRLTIVPKVP